MNNTQTLSINQIDLNKILRRHLYNKEKAYQELIETLNMCSYSEQEKRIILSAFEKTFLLLKEAAIEGMIYKRKTLAKYYDPTASATDST